VSRSKAAYIRWLLPPLGGKSRDNRTGIWEPGVSVYDAAFDAASNRWRYAGTVRGERYRQEVVARFPVFLVEGDFVGKGTDGEPTLANLVIRSRLRYDRDQDSFEELASDDISLSFASDPLGFLKRQFVVVPEGLNPATKFEGESLADFALKAPAERSDRTGNIEIQFAIASVGSASGIEAYWLPYKRQQRSSIPLGGRAVYLFTPNFNGCSFCYEAGPIPRAVHFASDADGCPIQTAGDSTEEIVLFSRLDQEAYEQLAREEYWQTNGSADILESRAMSTIVGVRDGRWKFLAQTRVYVRTAREEAYYLWAERLPDLAD
jgi:hypothetical protein